MASRQFTDDSAKKKEFINIFLLMTESFVLNAMRQAKFTKADIANVRLWRFLQHALPGGSIKGLKAYIAGLLPLPPDCRQRTSDQRQCQHPHLPVDPAAAHPRPPRMRQYLATAAMAARAALPKEVVVDARTTVLSSLLPGTAKKCKKRKPWDCNYYKKKEQNDGTIFIGTRHCDDNDDDHNYDDDSGGYSNYHAVSDNNNYNGNNNINGCSLLDGWCTWFSAHVWGNKDGKDAPNETGC
jgi:hypothetical protein